MIPEELLRIVMCAGGALCAIGLGLIAIVAREKDVKWITLIFNPFSLVSFCRTYRSETRRGKIFCFLGVCTFAISLLLLLLL